ncbi:MAG: HlyD family efflux transporter periplasmic adaptor subunit [Calothrix sp. FI2-JRJ7]|jgi:HlyD family secretion protein|nr:HlyD family efflux transporter periplasmic adaptor subunit [Calothrix sp. FI2-JRJ7]
MANDYKFDQPVLLEQSSSWSRAIAWGIFGITAFTITWASVFKIDEAIHVTGKLEPKAPVTDIQAPVGGVVKTIHVKDGESVQQGKLLVSLEKNTAEAELGSLQNIRTALIHENNFYRNQMESVSPVIVRQKAALLAIKPEIALLTQSRAAFVAENQLYRAQLQNSSVIALTPEQNLRLQERQKQQTSLLAGTQMEIEQAKQQYLQNQTQLVNAKEVLEINQKILKNLDSLAKKGAYPRLQTLKQEQDVRIKTAEVAKLDQEQQRLKIAIAQAQAKLQNTSAQSKEDIFARITTNDKSIAEIDSQLTKIILENQKKISEIDSKVSQTKTTLKYQSITSPINGTVFELKAKTPGYVTTSSEPILKIVPKDNLVAKVYITNRDIGFVHEGQQVDVRIDSFPFQEYGDIKGELIEIGSDALPPDQVYQYWRFPAKVRLTGQTLKIAGRHVALQSGMSINANVKLRKRTIMSIFTDFLVQKTESLKFVR